MITMKNHDSRKPSKTNKHRIPNSDIIQTISYISDKHKNINWKSSHDHLHGLSVTLDIHIPTHLPPIFTYPTTQHSQTKDSFILLFSNMFCIKILCDSFYISSSDDFLCLFLPYSLFFIFPSSDKFLYQSRAIYWRFFLLFSQSC